MATQYMYIRILLLLLCSSISLAQNSWINVQLQTDDYPEETSWSIYDISGAAIAATDSALAELTLYDTLIDVLAGEYIIELNDDYGDGLGAAQWGGTDGWFLIQNECQDTLFYAEGDFGLQLVDTLTIAPCAPPLPGCIDSLAINFNPTATVDDGSCEYPGCDGILTSNAYDICIGGGTQTQIIFEWTLDDYNPNCEVTNILVSNEEGLGPLNLPPAPVNNFGFIAGNGQMPPNWSVEHYCVLEFIDGSVSDTIAYTPSPCIAGCTDPTQIAYNPWATFDDGTCTGTSCDTTSQYQITMEIMFDNWPGETGWTMVTNSGPGVEMPDGTYNFQDIGQTYTYTFCVDQTAPWELIVTDTYGDGMAGSSSGGNMDGTIVVYDCAGDTLWNMDNPGFGNVLYSGAQNANPCPTIPTIPGCIDDDYVEFNPEANEDDGSCATLHTYGCTDPNAFNYDPNATIMDLVPDCNYELWIGDAGGDGWGNSYLGIMQNGLMIGTYTMGPGSYEQTFGLILDPGVPVEVYYFEVGGPQQPPQEVEFQTWHNSFKLTNANGVELMYEGYNPFADNGQGALQNFTSPFWTKYVAIPFCGTYCIPTVVGCLDPTAYNYNEEANTDDGSCEPIVEGCTNDLAFNYNPEANVDDDSCVALVVGCTDSSAWNYNADANEDDGACIYLGCTDSSACNYNPGANADSGGCTYPDQYYNCSDVCINDADSDGICDELEILGCTSVAAINYMPEATDDDGSCVGIVYGCTDPTAFNYDATANTDNGSCVPVVYGCIDSTAFNYDPAANTDNGTCIEFVYGCTDETALNFDPLANTLDNSCCYLGGCTDATALNYDEDACYDDGSCVVIIEGCADPNAYNYDPLVNLPDNSTCLYDAGCYGGPGEPYWLNDPCYAWVIDIDSYCCTELWDETCQSMYNYCEDGWPVDLDELSGSDIVVYPNPTANIFTVETRLDVDIELYNMIGEVIKIDNIKRIDLSDYPNGMYNLIITYDKIRITKKIIKL